MTAHGGSWSPQPLCLLQCGAVITRSIFSQKSQKTVRARYGVSFVDPASDWYSTSIPLIIYVMSYNIGPRYNGTRLYKIIHVFPAFPLAMDDYEILLMTWWRNSNWPTRSRKILLLLTGPLKITLCDYPARRHEAIYLNQCWFIIWGVLRHSPERHFMNFIRSETQHLPWVNKLKMIELITTTIIQYVVSPVSYSNPRHKLQLRTG